ncbi:MAG: hypothetical protein KC910_20390 [Candidatus Eremiobacteraeota bacterium]|nr:hypothetical protein [Candidatus Eremiobacteraeota bacterium]
MRIHAYRPPVTAAAPRKDPLEEMRQAQRYLEENPDATFEEAYMAPYNKACKESTKAIDAPFMRLNVALMGGLATLHPLSAFAFGTTTGLGVTAMGALEAIEGRRDNNPFMVKAGLFNAAIGLSLAATPFVPPAARLVPLGLMGLREVWIRTAPQTVQLPK